MKYTFNVTLSNGQTKSIVAAAMHPQAGGALAFAGENREIVAVIGQGFAAVERAEVVAAPEEVAKVEADKAMKARAEAVLDIIGQRIDAALKDIVEAVEKAEKVTPAVAEPVTPPTEG